MAVPISSTSNFKKFVFKLLLPFIFSAIVLGYLFQLFIERGVILQSQTLGAYKVNRIINQNYEDETPIFGSSRAEQSYSPSILGKNYFNYGISGIQDNVILFFIQEECKKKKNTPIIINFDLDGLNYNNAEITNYLYNATYPPIKKILGEDFTNLFRIPFIKYYGFYDFYLMRALYDQFPLRVKIDKGARLELKSPSAVQFKEMKKVRSEMIFDFKNDSILEKEFITTFSQNRNRLFILSVAPYHSSCYKKDSIGYLKTKMFFKKLSAEKNVNVIDFSHAPYPDSLFFDTEHLNHLGSIRFSKELRDSIVTLVHTKY